MIKNIKEKNVSGWYTVDSIGLYSLTELLKDNFDGKDVYIAITMIDDGVEEE